MLNSMSVQILRHLFSKCFTNPYLVSRMPDDLTGAVEAAGRGEIELNPPVETWGRFRGKVSYDRNKCIGCGMCIKVCPANAIERSPEDAKKIIIHNDRCCFCAQCNDICPVDALSMSTDFAISSYDSRANVTSDSGKAERLPFQKEWTPRDGEPSVEVQEEAKPVSKKVYRVREEDCVGCTICAKICPVDAVTGKVKEKHHIDPEKCVGCGTCASKCPKGAIEEWEYTPDSADKPE